jgi:lipopolysaccharide export system protein LptA
MTHEAPEPATPRPGTPAPFIGLCALAAALAWAGSGAAQIETNSKSPIDVTADEAEVVNARCIAIWRGSAEVIQDKTRLRADTITLYRKAKGKGSDGQTDCGDTDRIVADGHVYYATPDQNAKGDHAVYTQVDDQIVVTGDVVVVQGKDVARGDRLVLHVKDHQATLNSRVTGPGKPGRVRGVFYPDKGSSAVTPATPPSSGPPSPNPSSPAPGAANP